MKLGERKENERHTEKEEEEKSWEGKAYWEHDNSPVYKIYRSRPMMSGDGRAFNWQNKFDFLGDSRRGDRNVCPLRPLLLHFHLLLLLKENRNKR
jgi:hypothetical protein